MLDVLVIVPCGKSKVWDKHPNRGPTPAADAYIGAPFTLNRAYAECYGDAWVVLSAKYGLIEPEFEIPEPYEVAFNKARTRPIATESLQRQIEDLRLNRYAVVVGLGGAAYRKAICAAFARSPVNLAFPFAGLPIGKMMQATKRAVQEGRPGFDREGPG